MGGPPLGGTPHAGKSPQHHLPHRQVSYQLNHSPINQTHNQGLHALFAAGAVASPAALGALGYRPAFHLFATIGTAPLLCWGLSLLSRPSNPSPLTVVEIQTQAAAGREEELSLSRNAEQEGEEDQGSDGEEEGEEPLPPVPRTALLLICCFFFVYVGLGAFSFFPSLPSSNCTPT